MEFGFFNIDFHNKLQQYLKDLIINLLVYQDKGGVH